MPFPLLGALEQLNSTLGVQFPYMDDGQRKYANPGELDYVKGWEGVKSDDVVTMSSQFLITKLAGMRDDNDVLYIRGHCSSGASVLTTKVFAKDVIEVEDLVNVLRGKLNTGFPGAIKIYACKSCSGNPSFTQRFADYMSAAGCKSCQFFGYPHEVSTGRYSRDKGGEVHKMDTQANKPASDARQLVRPNLSKDDEIALLYLLRKRESGNNL